MDPNDDGISGSGQLDSNNLNWGGLDCSSAIVDVTTKNCDTDPTQAGCYLIAIRTEPKT